MENDNIKSISTQALQRMPNYLHYLRKIKEEGIEKVSARMVADYFGLNDVQVRKDLSAVSVTKGKPKAGFETEELIFEIEELLGYHNTEEAVLVGVGSLGKAFLSYKGFSNYGLKIITAFDTDKSIIGLKVGECEVLDAAKISDMCRRMNINIGIITVPADYAQVVCDQLVAGGVKAIWNFAPIHISVPEGILVESVNLAESLAILSTHLKESMKL